MASESADMMSAINAKLQQFQDQVTKLQQMQVPAAAPPSTEPAEQVHTTTYPKVFRSDTVEDILENPQWKQELAYEFNDSELGAQAKNHTELLFLQFCEKQTGKDSSKLNSIRKAQADAEVKKEKKKAAPVEEPTK